MEILNLTTVFLHSLYTQQSEPQSITHDEPFEPMSSAILTSDTQMLCHILTQKGKTLVSDLHHEESLCLKLSLYQNPVICHVHKVPKRSHVTCSKFSWALAALVGSCCADSWTPSSCSLPTETCSTGFTSPVSCASFWFVTACLSWHMREGKSVSSLALQIRVKCKEFYRMMQNSFKRDGSYVSQHRGHAENAFSTA